MFDRIAPVYDTMNRVMTAGLDLRWRRLAASEVVQPGDRVLDAACGTGDLAIADDRAGALEVTGLDFSPRMLERARRKAPRLRFVEGDMLALPFPDGSFDAAFAHTVIMGLREPVRALVELRRVLRPDGMAGLRDPDLGTEIIAPTTPLLDQRRTLLLRVREHNGGDPFAGRRLRGHLLAAHFARAEATASVWSAGSLEETRRRVVWLKAQLLGLARTGLGEGWIDQETLDAMSGALDAWADRPDAYSAITYVEAVGWVSEVTSCR